MRGDRPQLYYTIGYYATFTPHARGSTLSINPKSLKNLVYPACAGIDPYPSKDGK